MPSPNSIGFALPILIPALLLSGCSKEFLDRQPISNTTPSEVYRTLADAEALLNGAYNGLYDEYYVFDFITNGDAWADNCYAGGDNPSNFEIDEFRYQPANGNIQRDWRYLYADIKAANIVVENVPDIPDPALDYGNRRAQIVAEAKTIRALHYFNLVRTWGGVPLVLKIPAGVEEINRPRADEAAVYEQIIRDLEEALPDVQTWSADRFVVTRGAVNALLAKVHASKPQPDWNKVLAHCDAVVGDGYGLLDDYNLLFEVSHENNSEAIWSIHYDGWSSHGNWAILVLTGSGWKKFCTPSNDLIRAYEQEGDSVRLQAAIRFEDQSNEGWTDCCHDKAHFPFIHKYRDPDGRSDIYIVRLADILLLKAEALIETNQTEAAAALVNLVRARVGLPAVAPAGPLEMRRLVEHERRLELAFEGHRWFDLRRTGRAIAVMIAQTDGNGANLNYQVQPYQLLFPIPQQEIDLNPNCSQNPGYE